jgi:hypothetical protein
MSFFTTYTPPTRVSRISLCHAPGFDDFWIDNYLFFGRLPLSIVIVITCSLFSLLRAWMNWPNP